MGFMFRKPAALGPPGRRGAERMSFGWTPFLLGARVKVRQAEEWTSAPPPPPNENKAASTRP